ncbi:5'-nucleotidase domain-containing protein 3 isoform X2 [Homalodisca vitripennis]|uniref:5'-nucleotidase domain-containing protein 3 isoform X2 n=1 Tax=Homalodisca vitripennis TaxID=197043 RepID=UPI001EEB9A31|nr:5'-nucleotidase domain-containing protein 3 isoform X2 [Homalodisca vitripennis]
MNFVSLSRLCQFSQSIGKQQSILLQWTAQIHMSSPRKTVEIPTGDPIDAYFRTKQKYESKKLPPNVNPRGVFACNELDLDEVKVYGFDYDYTLAVYKPSMDFLLYNLGRDTLISKFKYPEEIGRLEYTPGFAIRGLHYDIEKGLLMKIDSFLQIQLGTVYRGLSPVSDEEVLRLYKNKIIPLAYVETHGKSAQYFTSKMVQLADMFSVPEMALLCNIAEYFEKNGIDYHPEILFRDVKSSVGSSHPVMHNLLQKDVSRYIEKNPGIVHFFQRLVDAGKKLFLVTNSPYKFVNKGMSWMVGDDWENYFDVIIVQARKPLFFTDESRPLRVYDKEKDTYLWDRVTELKKGTIYFEGTISQLKDMTGWYGSEVLYFGDHPYSDLADVTLEHGWRTGAIINELVVTCLHFLQTI